MPQTDLDYRALFDASPNPYLVLDRALNIVGANRAYLAATQRTLEEIVGRWAWDAFPTDPQTLEQSIASVERVIRTGQPDTMPLLRFDIPRPLSKGGGSEKRFWSITHVPVVGADGEVAAVLQHPIDVTELERARDEVRISLPEQGVGSQPAHSSLFATAQSIHESKLAPKAESDSLRHMFAQAPSFMAILHGPEHRFELTNEAYGRLVGGRKVIGLPIREALSDLEGQAHFELLDHAYRSGEPFVGRNVAFDLPKFQGAEPERRFIDFVFQPMFDSGGAVSGIFVEGGDVTVEKKSSDELRQREERLRLVVDGAKDHAILTTDPHGTITSWSLGAAAIFGWSPDEAIDQPFSIIFTPEDRAFGIDVDELRSAARLGYANDERWHVRKDASRVFMNGSVHPLPHDSHGRPSGFLKIARDETERRRTEDALRDLSATLELRVEQRTRELQSTEEQLRQAQKMEAIGQLTGGIAHDFNNFLATITSSLELMRRRIAAGRPGDLERFRGMAASAAQRAGALIQRLLAFARKQSLDLRPVDVNLLVTEMADMLRRSLGESIRLELSLDTGVEPARSDKNQLESALLNLGINARDAMPQGGTLQVRTASAVVSEEAARSEAGLRPGSYVLLSVTDTGTGMSAEVISKAFDPFFTTKPVGQGTGLGLSMIYGFARQTGGLVRIDSALGTGTTVSLFLPLDPGTPAQLERPEPTYAPATAYGRGETVLLVEDDPSVRAASRAVLDELGYVTHEASDAESALDVLDAVEHVDLLMADVGLAGTDGLHLALLVRARNPAQKVLFITGYTGEATLPAGLLEDGTDLLLKPFTIDALAHKLRALLEG